MTENKLYQDKDLQIILGVALMVIFGVASITPAFPQIMRELGISGGEAGLLITFFILPGMILARVTVTVATILGWKIGSGIV